MPRNLSAWVDLTLHLFIMLLLIGLLSFYNSFLALTAFVVWVCLALFAKERCFDRSRRFERYCKSVIANVNELMNYAMERLPQAIFVVDAEGRIQWANSQAEGFLGAAPEQDADLKDYWPSIILEPVWGTEGEYVFAHEDKYYQVKYRPVKFAVHQPEYMVLFVEDVTGVARLKTEYQESRTVLCYIQIDNYDEVMQRQSEAERTSLLLAVNQALDNWLKNLGGFMRRVSDDLYIAVLERRALDKAMAEKFDVLDKVRQLQNTNRLPVTLSMGVAVAEAQSMAELGRQAQAGLDLALGRGGDQVAVALGGKTQFFGGRAKAVEKHTRVKARVVAHAVREIMEGADAVYVMGHHNEDFDSFGAAMGVALMARSLGKKTHIILSEMNAGIDKFEELLKGKEEYEGLFVHAEDVTTLDALNPALFVVDTHIPHLVAAPSLLERVQQVVVIELLVILRDDQRADALAHAVDRHNRRVLAVEEALRILFIGAHARLRAQVGTSLVHAHEPADIVFRELALIDDLVNHEIAFEVVDKGIAVNLALLVGDIDVCIQDIAEHTRNTIVFYIFRTLKQTIDLACFFQ